MMGAGILPGPFSRADEAGLDEMLAALERAAAEWGETTRRPPILRRLVAQGRLGKKSGQGFFPYPQPDAGDQRDTVLLETRGDVGIAWLNRPPANPLSPGGGQGPDLALEGGGREAAGAGVRLLEHLHLLRGRRHQGVHEDVARRRGRASSWSPPTRSCAAWSSRRTVTIAAVNSIAFGGGCELAMACDFRIAAESATFGQPEINLGIIPGFGGTQRLPRLVGESKALEMNLVGDPIDAYEAHRVGLVNQVVPDHELLDSALSWASKLAGQAPLAVGQIKKVSAPPRPRRGPRRRGRGLRRGVRLGGRQGGHRRLPREAQAEVPGQVRRGDRRGSPRRAPGGARARRGPDRRGDLRAVGDPRLPHARHRALGERRPDGGRAHRRLARAIPIASGSSTGSASRRCGQAARTGAHRRWPRSRSSA